VNHTRRGKKQGQGKPVLASDRIKLWQIYFAAGASLAGSSAFFSAAFFAFFIYFLSFAGAAFSIFTGSAAGAGLSAAITVVQNAKTKATTNNTKRFI
jgi:hypothetical protein